MNYEEVFKPIKIKNPLDDVALIYVIGEVEVKREVGWGKNKRTIYPDGRVIYNDLFPEKIMKSYLD